MKKILAFVLLLGGCLVDTGLPIHPGGVPYYEPYYGCQYESHMFGQNGNADFCYEDMYGQECCTWSYYASWYCEETWCTFEDFSIYEGCYWAKTDVSCY